MPPDLAMDVKEGGAYYKEADKGVASYEEGDKWKFIRFVDTTLSADEAAALFGVKSKK